MLVIRCISLSRISILVCYNRMVYSILLLFLHKIYEILEPNIIEFRYSILDERKYTVWTTLI
jgi:hypothetical protein